MARRVFFSFHYENDINRAMVVRNSWVTQGKEVAGFIDKAAFEAIKRKGESAVHTSVTVVLVGAETLQRPFVQYEICESLNKGNAIIGVLIHNIKDMKTKMCSRCGNTHTVIGCRNDGSPVYFDKICHDIYDYHLNNGYDNLGKWIEKAYSSKKK